MARATRTALILALGALVLAGCGRKGPLEPPGGAVQQPAGEASPEAQQTPAETKADETDPAQRVLDTPRKP